MAAADCRIERCSEEHGRARLPAELQHAYSLNRDTRIYRINRIRMIKAVILSILSILSIRFRPFVAIREP